MDAKKEETRKRRIDEALSLLREGKELGIELGLEKGEIIGRICSYQELLAEPPLPVAQLRGKSAEELNKVADELKQRLAQRS